MIKKRKISYSNGFSNIMKSLEVETMYSLNINKLLMNNKTCNMYSILISIDTILTLLNYKLN